MPDLFDHAEPLRVVSLTPTQRDPNRAMVRVGTGSGRGKVVATLSTRLLHDLGVHVDQPWTKALEDQIADAVLYDKAFRAATKRLSRRAMSRKMVAEKLRELGHATELRDRVLDRLEELALIDDQAFGRALLRDLLNRKPAGPQLLKQKLYQKGITGALADELIREATADDEAQRQSAIEFATKRAASLARFDAPTRKRRLYGQLARRGFDPDTIRLAMDAVEDECQGTSDG
ncbi:MAG: regulatory protein RecX [Planctomycetota bacterium]